VAPSSRPFADRLLCNEIRLVSGVGALGDAIYIVRTTAPTPLWDPRTGRFDGTRLRLALVSRGWTPEDFAENAKVSRSSVYKALQGVGVRDRTAIAIFAGLAQREPMPVSA
jgi:hypothetical protein